MSDLILNDREQLAQIAKIFAEESQKWEAMCRELQTQARQLESGDWIGKAARMFQAEMQGEIAQACQKLISAMREASTTITVINRIFDEAEEEGKTYANFLA